MGMKMIFYNGEESDASSTLCGVNVVCPIHAITLFKPRLGSEIDVKRLSETFALMGYGVRTPYVDLTKDELFAVLKSIHEADHSLCDSFILCILSHGDEGIVFTYDDAVELDVIYEAKCGLVQP
jgi:hypothetical protein